MMADNTQITQAWFLWFNQVKQRLEQIPGNLQIAAEQIIGVLKLAQIPVIPWLQVDKTGSSLADLSIKSASALNSGVLGQFFGGTGRPNAFSYRPGSVAVTDGTFGITLSQLQVLGSDRLTVVGSGRMGVL